MAVGSVGNQRLPRRVARHQSVSVGLDGKQLSRQSLGQAEVELCVSLAAEIQPHRLAPRRTEDCQRPAKQIADGQRPLRDFLLLGRGDRRQIDPFRLGQWWRSGRPGNHDRLAVSQPNLEPRGDRSVLVFGMKEAVGEQPPAEGIALARPLVAHVVDHSESVAAAIEPCLDHRRVDGDRLPSVPIRGRGIGESPDRSAVAENDRRDVRAKRPASGNTPLRAPWRNSSPCLPPKGQKSSRPSPSTAVPRMPGASEARPAQSAGP